MQISFKLIQQLPCISCIVIVLSLQLFHRSLLVLQLLEKLLAIAAFWIMFLYSLHIIICVPDILRVELGSHGLRMRISDISESLNLLRIAEAVTTLAKPSFQLIINIIIGILTFNYIGFGNLSVASQLLDQFLAFYRLPLHLLLLIKAYFLHCL